MTLWLLQSPVQVNRCSVLFVFCVRFLCVCVCMYLLLCCLTDPHRWRESSRHGPIPLSLLIILFIFFLIRGDKFNP